MLNRLILGTANFVHEYNGSKVDDVDAILDYAKEVGVWAIDTATEYDTHHLEYPRKIVKVQKHDVLLGEAPLCIMAHGLDAYERAISLAKEKDCALGASLYPDDFDGIQEYAVRPQAMQLPYSVFDRRIEEYLPSIKQANIQVHARSIFLCGRVFAKTDAMSALMFVLSNQFIDKVVIGTESLQMLQDTLEPLRELRDMKIDDEEIIDPRKWREV